MNVAPRPSVHFLPGRSKRVRTGHPWVYSNEVRMDEDAREIAPGSVVRLIDAGGETLGAATFNPHSLIAGRMLSSDAEARIDRDFFVSRLELAVDLRGRLFDEPFYRLAHAEGDSLPGFVIDRFGDVVVCQANTAGADRQWPDMLAAIEAVIRPRAVVLRSDSPVRRLEGLDVGAAIATGTIDGAVEVREDGVAGLADVMEGQKTGWYFDQRESRRFMARLAPGARVLDVYSYSGAFALHAAAAGAAEVQAIDRSEAALALGARAAELGGVAARCRFRRAEAFAELARLADEDERFDVLIADPPSFVKSRKDLKSGLRGYRKLTRLAAARLAPGGFLFVASCSHNVSAEDFADAVRRGIGDAGRGGRILRAAGASADHPQHPSLPEGAYLKSLALQID